MKVLGIDPGYDRMGVAILEGDSHTQTCLFSDCFITDKKETVPDRLHTLGLKLEEVFKEHAPEALAIETLFFSRNTTTALAVAEARGMVLFIAKKYRCRVFEYSPQAVKIAVTGYGKSEKTQVTEMTKKLVRGVKNGAIDDEYDAIAVAVTALASER